MNPKKRRMWIRQGQKRRRKNVSFASISHAERLEIAKQARELYQSELFLSGVLGAKLRDQRNLAQIEGLHRVKFKEVVERLRGRFPNQRLEVLDEGAGRSDFGNQLVSKEFAGNMNVTRTDIRSWTQADREVNVIGIVEEFGKGRFHLVVSSTGGAHSSPLPEKALFQIVSVLKPGGIGVVSTPLAEAEKRLPQLAKRFNITIHQINAQGIVFTKNVGGAKGKRKRGVSRMRIRSSTAKSGRGIFAWIKTRFGR
ncbi:MAG: class I SAM-dependent methyltransferase [Candidatus Diapherotrites archaeon]|nr:class I SAM-dependent methyltransferase [Candidatus Diapherotrites archaeon]